jgi:hypothetical protein
MVVGFFVLLLLLVEGGFRAGNRVDKKSAIEATNLLVSLEAAILGMLGLLLGFTISMAVSRFENRKYLVLDEANALGTAYLRTSLLQEPGHKEIAHLLCQYVGHRLEMGSSDKKFADLAPARSTTTALQNDFWTKAVAYAKADPHPLLAGLLIQELNQSIDLEESRWTALQNSVPKSVLMANALVALLAAGLVGYTFGMAGVRQIFSLVTLALVVTLVLGVIIDLDRPNSGFIRISQQPMADLYRQVTDAKGNCK